MFIIAMKNIKQSTECYNDWRNILSVFTSRWSEKEGKNIVSEFSCIYRQWKIQLQLFRKNTCISYARILIADSYVVQAFCFFRQQENHNDSPIKGQLLANKPKQNSMRKMYQEFNY